MLAYVKAEVCGKCCVLGVVSEVQGNGFSLRDECLSSRRVAWSTSIMCDLSIYLLYMRLL